MSWKKEDFAKRLEKAISESAETASSLGKRFGFKSQGAIGHWMYPETPTVPTIEQIAKAAEWLGVSPCWLAYGEKSTPMNAQETRLVEQIRSLPTAYLTPVRTFLAQLAAVPVAPVKQPEPSLDLTIGDARLLLDSLVQHMEKHLVEDREWAETRSLLVRLKRQFDVRLRADLDAKSHSVEASEDVVEVPGVLRADS